MQTRILSLLSAAAAFAQMRTDNQQYNGTDLPPRHIVATFDDGVASVAPASGQTQTQLIAQLLAQRGVVAVFFQVGCHFDGPNNPVRDPLSSACLNGDTHPVSIEQSLLGLGHIVANHTWFHVPLTTIKTDPARVLKHVKLAQQLLDPFQLDGLKLFRPPGLAFDSDIAAILNGDPVLAKLAGPVGMDIDATGTAANGQTYLGDYDWYAKGMSPEDCAEFYLAQIQQRCTTQGCMLLIHDRSDQEITTDWGFRMTRHLLDKVDSSYRWVPPDAVPGLLGNIRLDQTTQWTQEFGAGDGVGAVVLGDIAGSGMAGACKARADLQVWCGLPGMSADGTPALEPATAWRAISDPDWAAWGQRFWLADIDGDGRADLIYATSQGFWVALSNGRSGFGTPRLWLAYFSAARGWDVSTLLDGVRFGTFYDACSKGKDLFVATPKGFAVAKNYAGGFGAPLLWSGYVPTTAGLATLQVRDLDGDRLDDVIVRDETLGKFLVFTVKSTGFGGGAFQPRQAGLDFSGQSNATAWNDAANGATVKVVQFGNRVVLTAGATTGLVYSALLPGGAKFNPGWRHLCNTCYTSLTDWRPERQSFGVAWADLDGGGSDWVVLTRSTGLDIARGMAPQN